MTDKKNNLWLWTMLLGLFFGFVIGIIVYGFICPVKEIEISPRGGENVLDFYVSYLRAEGYAVLMQNLSVNDFRQVEDFKEFLWLLEYGNFSECYVDYGYGEPPLVFGYSKYRVPKLWFEFDGVYWELRMND